MNINPDWREGYVPLTQIAVVALPDQLGVPQPHLAGLDCNGRVWIKAQPGEWKLLGNPTVEKTPLSTPE